MWPNDEWIASGVDRATGAIETWLLTFAVVTDDLAETVARHVGLRLRQELQRARGVENRFRDRAATFRWANCRGKELAVEEALTHSVFQKHWSAFAGSHPDRHALLQSCYLDRFALDRLADALDVRRTLRVTGATAEEIRAEVQNHVLSAYREWLQCLCGRVPDAPVFPPPVQLPRLK
jgi:hypothetical protein